jgi:hypothetical protein
MLSILICDLKRGIFLGDQNFSAPEKTIKNIDDQFALDNDFKSVKSMYVLMWKIYIYLRSYT